jgi:hypothetical protein
MAGAAGAARRPLCAAICSPCIAISSADMVPGFKRARAKRRVHKEVVALVVELSMTRKK